MLTYLKFKDNVYITLGLIEAHLNRNSSGTLSENVTQNTRSLRSLQLQQLRRVLLNFTRSSIPVDSTSDPVDPNEDIYNPITFDTNLPAEHSYLGKNMNRVSGVEYLDVGKTHKLMLFLHLHIVYPGEVLPFMIPGYVIDASTDSVNGLLFGVAFPGVRHKKNDSLIYGVTCQIYEMGTDDRGNTLVKSRALQRFITSRETAIE